VNKPLGAIIRDMNDCQLKTQLEIVEDALWQVHKLMQLMQDDLASGKNIYDQIDYAKKELRLWIR